MEDPPSYGSHENGALGIPSNNDDFQSVEAQSALIRSIQSADDRREYVTNLSMELLLREECDWGALLSHALRALCSVAQCFVVASTPMALSIKLSASNELQ